MLCATSCTNNVRSFGLIFCFKHLYSNICFQSFLEKFNAFTWNLNKVLIREKSFVLDFWPGFEYASAESSVFRSIHPKLYRKIAFLKGFSKFLERFPWWSLFRKSYKPKQDSFMGVTLWSSFFWCFLNSYIKDYLEFFDTFAPPPSNCAFPPT